MIIVKMDEGTTNNIGVVTLQYINAVSDQHIYTLNTLLYVNYISV